MATQTTDQLGVSGGPEGTDVVLALRDKNGADAKTGVQEQGDHKKEEHKKEDKEDKKEEHETEAEDKPSGGYDDTPLPEAPPGWTVKITFHKASNLPAADLSTTSSDPYLTATLTADVPTRHKEDPIMEHRTRTIHKSLTPAWEEDWIVANVPSSGFRLKCRLYDEDPSDHDDRLGNVTIDVPSVNADWGLDHVTYEVKKRVGSKRAYFFKAAASALTSGGKASITPLLTLSVQVLGSTPPPGGRLYTIGPSTWIRHFSPMIGRLVGTTVNADERQDEEPVEAEKEAEKEAENERSEKKESLEVEDDRGRRNSTASWRSFRSKSKQQHPQTRKYDFQANELQLQGPVPPALYHRYVEFRPIIGRMFTGKGVRGHILNSALHKQHRRIYNFGPSTEYGSFAACTEEASLQFLRLAHFDEGGRIFTYMISLDGVMRFTETGKEFGIDLLSKHSMHSDVATYIAFSGEFFIRRLSEHHRHRASASVESNTSRPSTAVPGPSTAPSSASVATATSAASTAKDHPGYYQLIIDNDSGTYRPEKTLLPVLQQFLEHQFPGLGVVARSNDDPVLVALKNEQHQNKKKAGPRIHMVLNRSPSSSSFGSSDESRLSDMDSDEEGEDQGDGPRHKSKKERAWDLLEDPSRIKDLRSDLLHSKSHEAEEKAKADKTV